MTVPTPHFLLYSEAAACANHLNAAVPSGNWHFVLAAEDGSQRLDASDHEPEIDAERLELLAVVRGLEALDQPSAVTVVTRNHAIERGLRFGLRHWRENNWHWERFGRFVPIKNADLWQRVDQALQFHQVGCRTWRVDAAHDALHSVVEVQTSRSPTRNMGLLRGVSRTCWRLGSLPFVLAFWPVRCFYRCCATGQRAAVSRPRPGLVPLQYSS